MSVIYCEPRGLWRDLSHAGWDVPAEMLRMVTSRYRRLRKAGMEAWWARHIINGLLCVGTQAAYGVGRHAASTDADTLVSPGVSATSQTGFDGVQASPVATGTSGSGAADAPAGSGVGPLTPDPANEAS